MSDILNRNEEFEISYSEALREGLEICLQNDPNLLVFGEGVNDITGMFGTTLHLGSKYPNRILDTPNSELGFTGMALGCAIRGIRSLIVHQRNDFLFLALDQIINQAAKWSYIFNEKAHAPITIRAVIGRGFGQGAQHSQNLQSVLSHFPGVKVVCPSNPIDAKGMLIYGLTKSKDPFIILEHRWSYKLTSHVPKSIVEINPFKAQVVEVGCHLTIITSSYLVDFALNIAQKLKAEGILLEVIDLRSLQPIDFETIKKSLLKTRRAIILDDDWTYCGISAEISSQINEDPEIFNILAKPIIRIGWNFTPAPTSTVLEDEFYIDENKFIVSVLKILDIHAKELSFPLTPNSISEKRFDGSF